MCARGCGACGCGAWRRSAGSAPRARPRAARTAARSRGRSRSRRPGWSPPESPSTPVLQPLPHGLGIERGQRRRQHHDQPGEGPECQARDHPRHVDELGDRHEDSDQEHLHHAPGLDAPEQARRPPDPPRHAPEVNGKQDVEQQRELDEGRTHRGEADQRGDLGHPLLPEIDHAGDQCGLRDAALHVEVEEGEAVRDDVEHEGREREGERPFDRVASTPAEHAAAAREGGGSALGQRGEMAEQVAVEAGDPAARIRGRTRDHSRPPRPPRPRIAKPREVGDEARRCGRVPRRGSASMTARIQASLFALVVSLAACATTPSEAGLTPWNQARVTELSQRLLAASNGWYLALLQQGKGRGRLQQNAIALQQQTSALAAHLEDGQRFGDTVYDYLDLRELMDDADQRVDASYLEQPAQDAWAKLSGLMKQITPYYDARPFGS